MAIYPLQIRFELLLVTILLGSISITCQHTQVYANDITSSDSYGVKLEDIWIEVVLDKKLLNVYRGASIIKSYPVGIGQEGWETPVGEFQINQIVRQPIWQNPLTNEVISAKNIDNPLGGYWLGFSIRGELWYGFHETNEPDSVGKKSSHGCLRMHRQQIQELFALVKIGTPVKIVQMPLISEQEAYAKNLIETGERDLDRQQPKQALEKFQQALTIYQEIRNQQGETNAIIASGRAYQDLEEFAKSLELYQRAFAIIQKMPNKANEVKVLERLASVYADMGRFRESLDFYQKVLEINQQTKNRKAEGQALSNIALAYDALGNPQQALENYAKALEIIEQTEEPQQHALILNNMGLVYTRIGQYPKALQTLNQALIIHRSINSLRGEAQTLSNIGLAYDTLGEPEKAIPYFREALAIRNQINDHKGEAVTLNSMGLAYNKMKQFSKALEVCKQALIIHQKIGDFRGEGISNTYIGISYYGLQQYALALEFYEKALAIAQKIGHKRSEAVIRYNIGLIYESLRKHPESLYHYNLSLAIRREIKDTDGEGRTLGRIAAVLAAMGKPQLAITFYKISINITEVIRQDLKSLGREELEAYTLSVADNYRNLADLLLKEDRILEAQQVLDLLKVEELSEYLRTVRGNSETIKGADFQNPEKNIIALSNELAELQKRDREGKLDPQQQSRLAFLTNNEQEYNKQFNAFLQTPAVQKEIQELRHTQSAQNIDIEKYNRLRGNLSKLQNAALFYPIILDDRLELILIIANAPPIRKTINLKRPDLNQAIATFLSNLRNPNSEVKANAQQFYNWLIQPFEKELQQANIQTIVYAPDEGLRYIPLAALYDGKQWLVERYRINNITAASLTDFTPHTTSSIRVLAAASSAKHDVKVGDRTLSFSALPATKLEVDSIADKINTTKLVDRDFTKTALIEKLNTHNIIHLATHGHFEVGQPEQSFILLGDGQTATISDIGNWTLTNVSLVILSACETAIGGQGGKGKGIEIFGLGYQIHNAGASAAIATLWKVSDGGTERLMDAFYTAVKTGKVSNTEALRQAQVAMITGNYEGLGEARGIVSIEARPRSTTSTVPTKISHPYYWAAFILIGNGF